MASRILYPPTINSYEPAFIAGNGGASLKVYFSLPSFSNSPNLNNFTVHAKVMRQKDGLSVLNKESIYEGINKRYSATGALLNLRPKKEFELGNNCYSITIEGSNLSSIVTYSGQTFKGWIPGWTYKIQLRISNVECTATNEKDEFSWANKNGNNFSEWSGYCYTKAISAMKLTIPIFGYDSTDSMYNKNRICYITSTDFSGSIESLVSEANEDYESVEIFIYKHIVDLDGTTITEEVDRSGKIFKKEGSSFYYQPKVKFIDYLHSTTETSYSFKIKYTTENGYESGMLNFDFRFIEDAKTVITEASIHAVEDNLAEDEEEGRISLRLYTTDAMKTTTFKDNYNILVRRSSMKDNFAIWEDIKYLVAYKGQDINSYPIIYDYTAESGVQYKYGIQVVTTTGVRGQLVESEEAVIRVFEYSYLIGQGGQQLKLCFDNNMNSFKYQISENKTDTYGSMYPFFGRNGKVKYRVFPINGLISCWMDEQNTFLSNSFKSECHKGLFSSEYRNNYSAISNFIRENTHSDKYNKYNNDFEFDHIKSISYGRKELYNSNDFKLNEKVKNNDREER